MSSVLIIMSFINSATSYFLAKLIFVTITAPIVLIVFSAKKNNNNGKNSDAYSKSKISNTNFGFSQLRNISKLCL